MLLREIAYLLGNICVTRAPRSIYGRIENCYAVILVINALARFSEAIRDNDRYHPLVTRHIVIMRPISCAPIDIYRLCARVQRMN